MKNICLYISLLAILLASCSDDPTPAPAEKTPVSLTGGIAEGAAEYVSDKDFTLYALLSPGDEWKAFYIDADKSKLSADGTVTTKGSYYWPEMDLGYRFVGITTGGTVIPDLNEGGEFAMSAGTAPENDYLLSNNLEVRRTSVDKYMLFRHVMTQLTIILENADESDMDYAVTGQMNAGKKEGMFSALFRSKVGEAITDDGSDDYVIGYSQTSTSSDPNPKAVYYLVPDGSVISGLSGVKLNGKDVGDIGLSLESGDDVELISGRHYIVTLSATRGVVSASVSVEAWDETTLDDQKGTSAPSDKQWTVAYSSAGTAQADVLEIKGDDGKTYFTGVLQSGSTSSPVDMPDGLSAVALWFGGGRVELTTDDYAFADGALTISTGFVQTRAQLEAINDDLSGRYYQVADIDLSESVFTKLGVFKGRYDGKGFKISGLTFTDLTATDVGLFGVNEGEITNVTVSSGSIAARYYYAAICGTNRGTVSYCKNYADVSVTEYGYGAGITGRNDGGTIEYCDNYGTVTSTKSNVAGVVAYALNNGTIRGCRNFADLTLSANTFGGIAGLVQNTTIEDCVNYGNLEGTAVVTNSGGLVGNMTNGSVKGSYNYGRISINTTASGNLSSIGGISGIFTGTEVGQCVNYGEIALTCTKADGVGGITGELKGGSITRTCNLGAITIMSSGYYHGGIAGRIDQAAGTISACYNSGRLSSTANYVGGITSWGKANNKIIASYNTAQIVSTGTTAAGIIARNDGCQTVACYNTGDVGARAAVGGYISGSITACYTTPATSLGSGTVFAEDAWPDESTNDAWKTVGEGGEYWESRGSWSDTAPVYPTLSGMPELKFIN